GVRVACLIALSFQDRVLNAMIVENLTLALSFSTDAHPVVVQIPHCYAEIVRPHFNEFQCPNWLVRCVRTLRVSPNYKEKRAKKENGEYAYFHVFDLRFVLDAL